ncbi:RNA polymerase subunit sigma, partial [bacterium]|nr:RNA polymerase subunit sigma [bacterium]
METIPASLGETLARAGASPGKVLVLTGAGISAESGIPTFRGEEGYWKVGSRNYHPEELATHEAFLRMPDEIWAWYLHRRSVCRAASPNPAHRALVRLEEALGERFALVTQNVDGLHLRAGSSPARTLEIHGNIDFVRCSGSCSLRSPVPRELSLDWPRGKPLGDEDRKLLRCARCGESARPHVLWFHEYYEEELYRSTSALALP